MFTIDMDSLTPTGEFGSREWCEARASYGVKMLQAMDLPADPAWGFSEIYTCPPTRLTTEEDAGLHNIAASLQLPSPEFAESPTPQLGVPGFSRTTDDQKADFSGLSAVETA